MNINPFLNLISTILSLYSFVLFLAIVINWLTAFNILNTRSNFVNKLSFVLYQLTEPVLRRVRKYMPDLGGIDISPIIVLLAIQLIKNIMFEYFYVAG